MRTIANLLPRLLVVLSLVSMFSFVPSGITAYAQLRGYPTFIVCTYDKPISDKDCTSPGVELCTCGVGSLISRNPAPCRVAVGDQSCEAYSCTVREGQVMKGTCCSCRN